MKLTKKSLTLILILEAIFVIKIPSYILPAKIEGIYQSDYYDVNSRRECKSTVVLVSNPPLTIDKMKELWMSKKENILNKWSPLKQDCDSLYFVRNNLGRPHDSEELKYWVGDYQFCFKGALDNQCISFGDVFSGVSFIKNTDNEHFSDKYKDEVFYISYGKE